MTDIYSDNSTHHEGCEFLANYLQENHAEYTTLIQNEAKKIAKETLQQGGGVIEYKVPKSLLDHIIQKDKNIDKTAIGAVFREQVENKAFDLLIHNRHDFYWW